MENEPINFVGVLIVFLIILAFGYMLYRSLLANKIEVSRFWSKGLIPPNLSYTQDNLTLVYIALAGVLVNQHTVEKHQKLNFLYKFILQHVNKDYPEAGRNEYYQEIKGSLLYAMKHPLKLESASKWFISHKISDGHKLMLLKFMADLAYIDKQIHPKEMALIQEFSRLLVVPERQVRAILDPLRDAQEARARGEQEARRKTQRNVPKPSERERCCAILGVSREAQFAEIKRSYRKLVLVHHPDKFVNASPAEYRAAQAKFLEIQSAYELLEKLF